MGATSKTRERLLAEAEAQFARLGFEGTALRRVIAAAAVNPAAVHYHFGEKRGLLQAVLARRVEPLIQELAKGLAAARRSGQAGIRAVLAALLTPILALDPDARRLFARALTDEGPAWEEAARTLGPTLRTYLQALQEARPDLERDSVIEAFELVLGVLAIAADEPRVGRLLGARPRELEQRIDRAARCFDPEPSATHDFRGRPASTDAGPSWSELND